MKDSKDRGKQFETELKALLKKYNTEIEIEDVGYGWHISNVMKVYIPSIYDKDGEAIAEGADIVLGTYYDGD
jgi:hypothetical protein